MLSDRPFSISGICERDIDLLLLEEFRSNPEFATWFTSEALDIKPGLCSGALKSVTDTWGESDLEVEFRDSSGRTTRLLIENKIAANFQPRQALRYAERATSYRAELRARFGDQLQEGMVLTTAKQSGAVRIKVPAVSPSRLLPAQIDEVREGLGAARRLLAWYRMTAGSE
ncbi:MAG: hypothetical protein ABI718_13765 [Acidobacteriota bacterium]